MLAIAFGGVLALHSGPGLLHSVAYMHLTAARHRPMNVSTFFHACLYGLTAPLGVACHAVWLRRAWFAVVYITYCKAVA